MGKEKVEQIMERLESGIDELRNSMTYKQYLKIMSRFHNYSFQNTLLIAMQCPQATYVAGFNSWKTNFERHVKRGEKGITILAPCPVKKIVTEINQDSGLEEEVEKIIPRFRPVTVFDLSQTEGKELPQIGVNELSGGAENYEAIVESIKEIADVPIFFEPIDGNAKGYYSRAENKIVIKEGMSESQTIKTLFHELAHSRLHNNHQEKKDRYTKEVEAESIAFVLCSYIGNIDTSEYSFAYISGWSSEQMKEFKSSLNTIREESHKIIEEISEKVKEKVKAKEGIKDKLANAKDRQSQWKGKSSMNRQMCI